MADLNVCTFVGRLTKDAELKTVGAKATPLATFSIANNTGFGQYAKTQFFDCQMWGRSGESVVQYLTKGKQIAVTGTLEDNSYTNGTGQVVRAMRLTVTQLSLLADAKQPAKEASADFGATDGADAPEAFVY